MVRKEAGLGHAGLTCADPGGSKGPRWGQISRPTLTSDEGPKRQAMSPDLCLWEDIVSQHGHHQGRGPWEGRCLATPHAPLCSEQGPRPQGSAEGQGIKESQPKGPDAPAPRGPTGDTEDPWACVAHKSQAENLSLLSPRLGAVIARPRGHQAQVLETLWARGLPPHGPGTWDRFLLVQ